MAANKLSPLLVIVGETASGKSDLALKIAQHFNGEIICADSWTVRRDMNIGTAKPSSIERRLVRHHLLDIVDPDEDFTAAVFKDLANDAINKIISQGKLPILVGGTGLYIDGVIYNFGFLPQGDRVARIHLNALSVEQLLDKIKQLDLDLGDIDKRNKRRLIRLIETNGTHPTKQKIRPNTLVLGLYVTREDLNIRILERAETMLASGLEDEVKVLANHYGWECEGLKGVGYAQWENYFLGTQTLQETKNKIIKSTQDLAKRQRTWFKRNKSIHWLDTPVNWQELVDLLTTSLYK